MSTEEPAHVPQTNGSSPQSRLPNLLNEFTQALLAVGIVSTLLSLSYRGLVVPETLANMTLVVIGFYFGRAYGHEERGRNGR